MTRTAERQQLSSNEVKELTVNHTQGDAKHMIRNESDVAAVIIEPIVGTNGVLVPPKEYLPRQSFETARIVGSSLSHISALQFTSGTIVRTRGQRQQLDSARKSGNK